MFSSFFTSFMRVALAYTKYTLFPMESVSHSKLLQAHLFDFHNPSSFVVFFSVHVFVNFATRACICVCVCVRALFRSEHSMHFLHLPLCRIYLSNESHKIENTFFVVLGTPSSEH